MNIEDIKKSFNGICVSADIWHPDDMKLVNELIFKLEQAEKALEHAKDYLEIGMHYGPAEAIEEALQAIRKGD